MMNIRPPPGRRAAQVAISLEKRGGTWLAIGRKMDARSKARFSSRRPHDPRADAAKRTRKIIASGSDTVFLNSEAAPARRRRRRFTV